MASDLMSKEGYKIVFIFNPVNESLSIRCNLDGLHIGNFLKELGIGGGHCSAGGVKKSSKELLQPTMKLLEKLLYEKYPAIRR
jgi:nanoRNase/pAp phosphatase (c-di-AMP/oligoRNAs hydrolase)